MADHGFEAMPCFGKTNNTPVPWLSLTLPELVDWIRDSNKLVEEMKQN